MSGSIEKLTAALEANTAIQEKVLAALKGGAATGGTKASSAAKEDKPAADKPKASGGKAGGKKKTTVDDIAAAFGGYLGIKDKDEREVRRLAVGDRVLTLAAADDFLRMNESDDAAKKNRRWLNDPATGRQWELLQRLGYGDGTMLAFTKYSAACTLNFFWNRGLIEREVLHG